MGKKKVVGLAVIVISVVVRAAASSISVSSPPADGNVIFENTDLQLAERIEASLPEATQMVAAAISVLGNGWEAMSPEEQALFNKYFDPGKTGTVDGAFVEEVLANYKKIRSDFDEDISIVYQDKSIRCEGMGLYYTDFMKIYVCPFIYEEQNPERLARDLVHEMTHISLLAVDRAYFSETDSRYLSLTPRGHWTAELPIIGKLFREIAQADTLYHPDAYSRFASAALAAVQR